MAETGSAEGVADLVISDIEMPQIDGLHLTKRIKENPQLRDLPVLLYSSIVTPDNVKKGEAVGANMQISKPELNKIVEIADGLIANFRQGGVPTPDATSQPVSALKTNPVPEAVQPVQANVAAAAEVAVPITPKPPVATKPAPVAATATVAAAPAAKAERPRAASPARVPKGVNPQLWQTFVTELCDHVANLNRQLNDAASGVSFTDDETKEFFRTLHTIKSASMVIPCDPITHATHAIEDLLSPLRRTPAQWPQATLSNYVQWLEAVTSPLSDVNDALKSEQFRSLMTELS